ncbi:MAG TPA: DNA recombination protein RmuC [Gammaproteobacteria bacterium]|nr:DNA recombination protein RmuC [Gammaproteobacteria bacterium]
MSANLTLVFFSLLSLFFLGYLAYRYFTQGKTRYHFEAAFQGLNLSTEQLKERLVTQSAHLQQTFADRLNQFSLQQAETWAHLKEQLQEAFSEQRSRFDKHQLESFKILQESLQAGLNETRTQVKEALQDYGQGVNKRVEQLTLTTDQRLKEINQQVEKRLMDGFEKTNETFSNIIKRLALIDAAQKQISELSTNVVSLQEILTDKRSRGTFGEVQLTALIRNVLPEQQFSLQHQLSTNKRPDCMLFLPEPTGNIAIDAKFPLENYRLLIAGSLSELEKRPIEQQFRQDIRKHIHDIAEKYIIPGETADGAVMFIPAEAIFAEIHAHYPELVEEAHRAKVWMVSPTTMMAILTTARAVVKDAATRKQLHLIQEHLRLLANDFRRFQERMDNLAKHIELAHTDAEQVHTSAKKISQRFTSIEKVELEEGTTN